MSESLSSWFSSSGSGQCLLEPYHPEEFTQKHAEQLLIGSLWLYFPSSSTAVSGHCLYRNWVHSVKIQVPTPDVVCGRQMWWTMEDVFKFASVPATVQPTIEHSIWVEGETEGFQSIFSVLINIFFKLSISLLKPKWAKLFLVELSALKSRN